MSTQPDNPVHRPTAQPTASRYRRAAWAPLVSGVHRPANRITPTPGESFGLAGRQENGLTLVGTQFQLVLLRRCMYRMARVVLCQPAGVTTAPCRIDPTGLPEQALNLLLLVVSPSGTWKTMTKSHALRSQAVAPTTWNPAARTIPPVSLHYPPSIINSQPSNPPQRSRLPMPIALPPPTCCRPPPRCPRPPEPPS